MDLPYFFKFKLHFFSHITVFEIGCSLQFIACHSSVGSMGGIVCSKLSVVKLSVVSTSGSSGQCGLSYPGGLCSSGHTDSRPPFV